MTMNAISLQSGSNGNCIYVESCGVRLLFDAGINGVQAEGRLARYGREIREVDGVIISHDHADHARHAGVYQRKYGVPLFITPKTFDAADERNSLGRLRDVRSFESDGILRFGEVKVHAIPTPHDGADGAAFVVEAQGKRLGILTDLGHVFEGLETIVATLDAVFLESNYDPGMLDAGSYPAFLKRRIAGPAGHISNNDAAELLCTSGRDRLKWACLAHLSEENNSPSVALKTHRSIIGTGLELHMAGRHRPTGILSV